MIGEKFRNFVELYNVMELYGFFSEKNSYIGFQAQDSTTAIVPASSLLLHWLRARWRDIQRTSRNFMILYDGYDGREQLCISDKLFTDVIQKHKHVRGRQ